MISDFTVFDRVTGEIKRAGSCLDIDLAAQAHGENEAILRGIWPAADWYVNVVGLSSWPIVEVDPIPRPDTTFLPVTIPADGIDRAVVAGISPETRYGEGPQQSVLATAGEIHFSSTVVGQFYLYVEPPFPTRPSWLRVVATET